MWNLPCIPADRTKGGSGGEIFPSFLLQIGIIHILWKCLQHFPDFPEATLLCRNDSRRDLHDQLRVALVGLGEAFVSMLANWADGVEALATLGSFPAALAFNEQVFMVKGATGGLTGRYKIELSLFTPPGDGPFPLVLYNHGDITADMRACHRTPPLSGHVHRQ